MIYIVSGFMRSGTSMMMQSLEAGGMEVVKSVQRDEFGQKYSDKEYKVNPKGLYELQVQEMRRRGFPLMYNGKVLKVLDDSVRLLSVAQYKVVFMRRHPEEIRQSYEAAFEVNIPVEIIKRKIRESIKQLENRRDVIDLQVFEYREVALEPHIHFGILKNCGWPIDVEMAVSTIKPGVRFALEKLVEGI